MGNYNPNTPSPLGLETRYYKSRNVPDPTTQLAAACRIRPGAVTPAALHWRCPTMRGAPGIHTEIASVLAPAMTISYFYPGSDTGDTTTNFADNGGAALNFGDIDDNYQAAIYGRNSVALSASQQARAYFRGNNAGALAGRRILRVRIFAAIMNRLTVGTAISGNFPHIPVTGQVVMGGNTYIGNTRWIPKIDAFQQVLDLADWYLSPSTGLPWTVTEVDNIISAANADTMGINVFGKLDSQGMRCSGFGLEVTHCLDNRMGFLDQRGTLRKGWDRYPLGSTSVLAANTEYFAVFAALNGCTFDASSLSLMDPTLTSDIPSASASDNTKDHRQGSAYVTTGPGGIARDGTTQSLATDNEQPAFLFETAAAVINGESQAYAELRSKDVYSGAALIGQQLTTPGAGLPAAYSGVQFTVGWQDQCSKPCRPLTIEVRHGAGSINGGGTLDMTATLDPSQMPDGTFQDYFVPFNGSFVPAINTQYVVLFRSNAPNGLGYRFVRLDTRSDDIAAGSGTTLANVESATHAGQTDSYVESGAQVTRYDLGVLLIPPPAAPTLTAQVILSQPDVKCGTTLPPYVRLTWTATALGAAFGRYTVYRRRRNMPTLPWAKLSVVAPRADGLGPTAAQVEANFREFRDYEAAWTPLAATECFAVDGWDYAVTVYNNSLNLESVVGASPGAVFGVVIAPSGDDWQVSNQAPWINWPLRGQEGISAEVLSKPTVYASVAGRDNALARTSGQVPGRKYRLTWRFQDSGLGYSDEYPELRGPRAAARTGRQVALLRVRGDRAIGLLSEPETSQPGMATTAASDLTVTDNESPIVGFNAPAGLVLDGASQYVSAPSVGLLNPTTSPFSFFVCALVPSTASRTWMSKRAAADGYVLRNNASSIPSASFQGAGGLVNLTDDTFVADGVLHVWVATTTGAAQKFYRDGQQVDADAFAHGSVTNTQPLTFGARSDAAEFAALAPGQAWGVYPRALSADEVVALSRYLLGHAIQRVPVGPQVFYDLRDDRCFDGQDLTKIRDLSGNGSDAAAVASPIPRGTPYILSDLDVGR